MKRALYQIFVISLNALLLLGPLPARAQQSAAPATQQAAPPSAVAPVPKPQTVVELQAQIAALLDQPKFAAARWGALIVTSAGNVILERDADKSFTPASNMKLYTSSAVLDAFGPAKQFKTSVYATKPVNKLGVLAGDVILYGRGDPNLSARFDAENEQKFGDYYSAEKIAAFEQLADQLKAAGVKTITGNLIGDDSYFAGDRLGTGWEWDDMQFYYGAPISALTVNDNVITYVVKPARRAGLPPTITTKPATSYAPIFNRAVTSANGRTRIGVHRPLSSETVEFFGTIPVNAQDFEVEIAVFNPALLGATLLKEALQRRGIRVQGRLMHWDATARMANKFDETKLTELAFVQSQPLGTLLKVVNKPSQNLHTELVLRQLGAATGQHEADDYGMPKPTFDLANDARKQFLTTKVGATLNGLSLRDGSGLARADLVTPRSTVQLLQFMRTHQHATVFRESLPVAGIDGTLERRMKDTPAMANLRAKTGTLSYVNALSGYVQTAKGQQIIFSLMQNNYVNGGRDVTSTMDQIGALLAGFEGELP